MIVSVVAATLPLGALSIPFFELPLTRHAATAASPSCLPLAAAAPPSLAAFATAAPSLTATRYSLGFALCVKFDSP